MRQRYAIALAVVATAGVAMALPTSLNINFANQPTSTDVPDTGFDAAYLPTPSPNPGNADPTTASGFFLGPNPNPSFGTSNMLNIWTDPGTFLGITKTRSIPLTMSFIPISPPAARQWSRRT